MPYVTTTTRAWDITNFPESAALRIRFSPSAASVATNRVYPEADVVIDVPADGNIRVNLVNTDLLLFDTYFKVRFEWFEGGSLRWSELPGELRVPADGGDLKDLLKGPIAPTMTWVGDDPPPGHGPGSWWLNSTGVLKEWDMTLNQWVTRAQLGVVETEQPFIYHGSNADAPRTGSPLIGKIWVGVVEPRNMLSRDLWADGSQLPYSPRRYPGLHIWNDPRGLGLTQGDTVNRFDDQSGNGRHLLLSEGQGAPKFEAAGLSGTPAVRTDGASLIRTATFEQVTGPVTILANVLVTNTSNTGYVVGGSAASSGGAIGIGISQNTTTINARRSNSFVVTGTAAVSGVRSVVAVLDGANSRAYVNGSLVASGDAGSEPIVRWGLFSRFASSALQNPAASGSMVGDHVVHLASMGSGDVAKATLWLQQRLVA